MHTHKLFVLLAAAVTSTALGQPLKTDAPVQPTSGLGPVQSAPAPAQAQRPTFKVPDLVPLSPDFQEAMANSQLQTYRYNQLTEQAQALKKLCDTGFGPSEICATANSSTARHVADGVYPLGILPAISEIGGQSGMLSAVLSLEDGRRVTVHPGSVLPNGLTVASITEDEVRLSNGPGRPITLYFGGTASK
jgi:type IV pilus biogenesis protein PilP